MSELARGRAATAAFWTTISLLAFSQIPFALTATHEGIEGFDFAGLLALLGLVVASWLGRLIVVRAGNAIGWVFLTVALTASLSFFTEEYIGYSRLYASTSLPATQLSGWLNNLSTTWITTLIPLILLLFPDGKAASPRWRWAVRLWVVGAVAITSWAAFKPGPVFGDPRGISIANPFAVPAPEWVFDALVNVAAGCALLAGPLGLVSLIVRFVRARGEERQQIKWLALVAGSGIGLVLLMFSLGLIFGDPPPQGVQQLEDIMWMMLVILTMVGIPAAVAIAVLKYRLYDVDVVINKAVVYGALALFITAAYVGIVIGVGALAGSGEKPNVVLSVVATAVVAVAFQPVRTRVQRFANRLVYGDRATPYEVLSEFSGRMASTDATEDLLPRMARILAEGTSAARADVWLKVGTELRPTASWPHDDTGSNRAGKGLAPPGDELPSFDGVDRAVPVRHRGELLGALTIEKKPGDPVTPTEDKLLADLASQAGLVLRNVALIADLRASRQRLVAAQDEERRRLERNLHDGAQQQLVALSVKLRLIERFAEDPAKTRQVATQAREEMSDALENLRDLARGIYPPLLADKGLAAALQAQARKAPLPVSVEVDAIGRYEQETEAAVYFCALEALQNVAKYAHASRAHVRLSQANGTLAFEVSDDGEGFDPVAVRRGAGTTNMADRLAALDGELDVRSAPGRGTTVIGRLPVRATEAPR